jgi:peroxiredoxin
MIMIKRNSTVGALVIITAVIFIFTACTGNKVMEKTQKVMTEQTTKKEDASMETSTEKDDEMMETTQKTDDDANKSMSSLKAEKDFTLQDLNGNEFTLSKQNGKKVYIKFWSTWCSVCLNGLDKLSKLDDEMMNNDDISIITIVSPGYRSEMSSDKFIKWFKSRNYNFTVLIDESGIVAKDYGIRAYPTSVFIGTNGNIAKTHIGHAENNLIYNVLDEIE